jgi:hypothetical protein
MSGSDAIGYRLDEEQRARVRYCLTKAHRSLPQDRFRRFISEIEASIDHFATHPSKANFARHMTG